MNTTPHTLGRGLHATLADRLGRDIVIGRLAPGTVIDLAELRAEHEVSRTVTRETLRTVAAKGLVTALPNLGTRVTAPDRWHLLDPDVVAWTPHPSPELERFTEAVRVIGELLPGNRFYDHLMRTLARAQ